MLKVNTNRCNGDEVCTTVCPVGAAQMDEDSSKAKIDSDICMECYACMNICPQGAIFEDDEE
ncbi:MAG: 4Fe-4S binding protein [Firmicutes bacterium]|nr:4Fe-4S binding protein [Bacillota bacterium]NSW91398.1 4Fe-4S binding protein [Bacillota bacterium]